MNAVKLEAVHTHTHTHTGDFNRLGKSLRLSFFNSGNER